MRWLVFSILLLTTVAQRDRRQVTYQAEGGNQEIEKLNDELSIRPVTRKPLPLQVVYPGDLSSFFTTESVDESENNIVNVSSNQYETKQRVKRNMYEREFSKVKHKPMLAQESRPSSVSIMNDIPVEMSFDGAGFLRYEEDSDEDSRYPKHRNSGSRQRKIIKDNDFRAAINTSNVPRKVKYDDEMAYQNEKTPDNFFEEKLPQSTEHGTPYSVDFMTAFQHGMFSNINQANQATYPTQIPQQTAYDPFQFYQNMFNAQANNPNPVIPQNPQQESFLQNHRFPGLSNTDAMYSQIPQQNLPIDTTHNINMQQYQKKQRRKRSVSTAAKENNNRETEHVSNINYPEEASSGFLPITGTFNGGAIQLNFPFYGQSPIQIHTVPSMPVNTDGRYYRNSGERFYYPSEARRYSYGVLGSGNFEVIRGGVFPNERPQNNYHGGYQDGRTPYIGNNYGTTEVIFDGPIQGFQGFDNFNIQLINALSKHSELAVRPLDLVT
ncbi:uncharacterized protein [Parasteatoda tepidariorum]|uniref:uncharacterized protein isoform X1 n=2 Tax=Parasteatoda tepidariorum TaxID=114398 RepID=UPI000A2C026F|nr:uncharacterized protein LOC107444165 isoform X1 [Parasteatoda tepidariorum]